jgi:hypothetical protein
MPDSRGGRRSTCPPPAARGGRTRALPPLPLPPRAPLPPPPPPRRAGRRTRSGASGAPPRTAPCARRCATTHSCSDAYSGPPTAAGSSGRGHEGGSEPGRVRGGRGRADRGRGRRDAAAARCAPRARRARRAPRARRARVLPLLPPPANPCRAHLLFARTPLGLGPVALGRGREEIWGVVLGRLWRGATVASQCAVAGAGGSLQWGVS